jgi:hypothetical protein
MRKQLIKLFLLFLLGLGSAALALSQTVPGAPAWEPLRFLLGQWAGGEDGGSPAAGKGLAVFQFELDGKILVRHNQTDYPAAGDRPAFSHRDLLVVFPVGEAFRAIYFDNEGHVIQYGVEIAAAGDAVTFVSERTAGQPRFRLAYSRVAADRVKVQFAIAPPGKEDEFKPYLEALTVRKN